MTLQEAIELLQERKRNGDNSPELLTLITIADGLVRFGMEVTGLRLELDRMRDRIAFAGRDR